MSQTISVFFCRICMCPHSLSMQFFVKTYSERIKLMTLPKAQPIKNKEKQWYTKEVSMSYSLTWNSASKKCFLNTDKKHILFIFCYRSLPFHWILLETEGTVGDVLVFHWALFGKCHQIKTSFSQISNLNLRLILITTAFHIPLFLQSIITYSETNASMHHFGASLRILIFYLGFASDWEGRGLIGHVALSWKFLSFLSHRSFALGTVI